MNVWHTIDLDISRKDTNLEDKSIYRKPLIVEDEALLESLKNSR